MGQGVIGVGASLLTSWGGWGCGRWVVVCSRCGGVLVCGTVSLIWYLWGEWEDLWSVGGGVFRFFGRAAGIGVSGGSVRCVCEGLQ